MASASNADGTTRSQRRVRVFGIDPGSVNLGLCEYDVTHDRAMSLERIQLRRSGDKRPDLGNARIIHKLVKWITANADRFYGATVFIESQPSERGGEIWAVQHAFQAIMDEQCVPVAPAAVKARYAEHFPKHPRYNEFAVHRRQQNQYNYDKKNAKVNGRKFVPEHVRKDYEEKNAKDDDAYDAFWIARYGRDFLMEKSGVLRATPVPPRRRKRGETNPRPRNSRKRKMEESADSADGDGDADGPIDLTGSAAASASASAAPKPRRRPPPKKRARTTRKRS